MKETYQIEPAAGGGMMMPPTGPGRRSAKPLKLKRRNSTSFSKASMRLRRSASSRSSVRLTGQGLAEAKATVEGAPKNVKEGIDKAAAEEAKKKIEEAGGKVSIKPA